MAIKKFPELGKLISERIQHHLTIEVTKKEARDYFSPEESIKQGDVIERNGRYYRVLCFHSVPPEISKSGKFEYKVTLEDEIALNQKK